MRRGETEVTQVGHDVGFVLADLEGSTRPWEQAPEELSAAIATSSGAG